MANHSQIWVKHNNPLLWIILPPNGADEGKQNLFSTAKWNVKISDFRVILSGLRHHGQELSNCSTKQRLVLRAFYLIFFPSPQYYSLCWDIWSHCGKVIESPRMRQDCLGNLPWRSSALLSIAASSGSCRTWVPRVFPSQILFGMNSGCMSRIALGN